MAILSIAIQHEACRQNMLIIMHFSNTTAYPHFPSYYSREKTNMEL